MTCTLDLSACPYWVVVGDIHDQTARLKDIPELPGARGILVSGDLTLTGGVGQAGVVMDQLLALSPNVLAQFGNMDRPEVSDWLTENHRNLHNEVRELAPGVAVMGIGASNFSPFGTPSEYPENWFAERLERMWATARNFRHVVLISHAPPLNTACDLLSDGTTHVGSEAVREFIEDAQPALCICGHIHEARGMDRIGRTKVLNPGAFLAGGYVLLTLNPDLDNLPDAYLSALDA